MAGGEIYRRPEEPLNAQEPILNVERSAYEGGKVPLWSRASRSFVSWVYGLYSTVSSNADTAGISEFSANFGGRLSALEEEIRALKETAPAVAERAPDQAVAVSDVEELRQRVVTLEGSIGSPMAASSIADALETVREQAVADALSLAPAVETGQLFKPRTFAQLIDPAQMYLPTTQPAAGPNMYETVAGGSAFRCFEFAPGTLAADNDHVEFLTTPPDRWDGGQIGYRAIWSHSATATNFLVAWKLQAGAYYDNVSGTAALSSETATGAVMGDTGGTTDNVYISSASATQAIVTPANITPTVAGQPYSPILFRFGRRNQSESTTGLAVNARLLGVVLIWGIRAEALS